MALLDYSFNTDAFLTASQSDDYPLAQTFLMRYTSTLTSIKLKLYKAGSPGNLTTYVYATVGGKPSGAALLTGSILAADITTDTAGEWIETTFGAGASLAAGTQYAIAIAGSHSPGNYVWWKGDSSFRYGSGSGYFYLSGWQGALYDFGFELWGTGPSLPGKPTNPTPANTAVSVSLGLALLDWESGS